MIKLSKIPQFSKRPIFSNNSSFQALFGDTLPGPLLLRLAAVLAWWKWWTWNIPSILLPVPCIGFPRSWVSCPSVLLRLYLFWWVLFSSSFIKFTTSCKVRGESDASLHTASSHSSHISVVSVDTLPPSFLILFI